MGLTRDVLRAEAAGLRGYYLGHPHLARGVARDKLATPERERRFNSWTANVSLAICLSMLPVTSFTMLALLFLKHPTQADIYHWYCYTWLALGSYFIARQNFAVTNKQALWLSVAPYLLVPVLDGAATDFGAPTPRASLPFYSSTYFS